MNDAVNDAGGLRVGQRAVVAFGGAGTGTGTGTGTDRHHGAVAGPADARTGLVPVDLDSSSSGGCLPLEVWVERIATLVTADGPYLAELVRQGMRRDRLAYAVRSPLAFGGWGRAAFRAEFYVYGAGAGGTYVSPVANVRQVYCVAGMGYPLAVTVRRFLGDCPRPPIVRMTLVPWFGRIVADPVLEKELSELHGPPGGTGIGRGRKVPGEEGPNGSPGPGRGP